MTTIIVPIFCSTIWRLSCLRCSREYSIILCVLLPCQVTPAFDDELLKKKKKITEEKRERYFVPTFRSNRAAAVLVCTCRTVSYTILRTIRKNESKDNAGEARDPLVLLSL